MKHFVRQITVCILLLTLIFSFVSTLSFYHCRKINELQTTCAHLPTSLENDAATLDRIAELEDQLKKAGTSLAFFTHYEQLNTAYLAAASLRTAAESGDAGQYGRALCELKEALGTLLRNERPSFEAVI